MNSSLSLKCVLRALMMRGPGMMPVRRDRRQHCLAHSPAVVRFLNLRLFCRQPHRSTIYL